MAEQYLHFSVPFACRSEEELDWFREQLAEVYDPPGPGERRFWTRAEDVTGTRFTYVTSRFLVDFPAEEPPEDVGFDHVVDDEKSSVWFTSDDSPAPEHLGFLLQRFLARFRPDECFWFCWSTTSDELRVGPFAGGLVFVTPERFEATDVREWAGRLERRFLEAARRRSRRPNGSPSLRLDDVAIEDVTQCEDGYWLGTLEVLGTPHHAEFYRVVRDAEGLQTIDAQEGEPAANHERWPNLVRMYEADAGYQTVNLPGVEGDFVMVAFPYDT